MPCPQCGVTGIQINKDGKCSYCGFLRVEGEGKCPKCRNKGYWRGEPCLNCNYIDGAALRSVARPPPRPATRPAPPPTIVNTSTTSTLPPPPLPRDSPAPVIAMQSTTTSSSPPRKPPPPPPTSATSTLTPPPPLPRPLPMPPRTAPAITPTHLSTSGGDWVEEGFEGTSIRVHILLQPQLANCGPAALCMIVRRCTGKVVATGMMGATVRHKEKADVAVEEAIDFSKEGAYFEDLLMVLTSKYPDLHATKCDLITHGRLPLSKQLENGCSPTKPALCHIEWTKGGHFTLCLGVRGGKFLFADPYYGAVVMPVPSAATDALIYDTSLNSTGKPAGVGKIRIAAVTNP